MINRKVTVATNAPNSENKFDSPRHEDPKNLSIIQEEPSPTADTNALAQREKGAMQGKYDITLIFLVL